MSIFGGSLGKWWQGIEKGLSSGGEFGKLTKSLKQTSDVITDADYIGGSIGEQLFHRTGSNKFNAGLANLDRTTMGWSRQASPFWEGGLTKPGGTTQDIFGTEEQGGMLATWLNKAGHHVFGQKRAGYGSSGSSSSGSGDTSSVVSTDTEDPSLINQGDWQAPGSIDTLLRRENMLNRGGLATDLTKTQRGRLSVANLA